MREAHTIPLDQLIALTVAPLLEVAVSGAARRPPFVGSNGLTKSGSIALKRYNPKGVKVLYARKIEIQWS